MASPCRDRARLRVGAARSRHGRQACRGRRQGCLPPEAACARIALSEGSGSSGPTRLRRRFACPARCPPAGMPPAVAAPERPCPRPLGPPDPAEGGTCEPPMSRCPRRSRRGFGATHAHGASDLDVLHEMPTCGEGFRPPRAKGSGTRRSAPRGAFAKGGCPSPCTMHARTPSGPRQGSCCSSGTPAGPRRPSLRRQSGACPARSTT